MKTAATPCCGLAAAFLIELFGLPRNRRPVMSSKPVPAWKMTKTELQAECNRLGIPFHTQWTVPELKHILSEHREARPSPLPKRLTSMTLAELRAEAEHIGIGFGPKETKGSITLRIRDALAPDQTLMTVGRHTGVPYEEVPENYGAWASEEERQNGSNMHPDLRRFVNWRREKRAQAETTYVGGYFYDDPEASAVVTPPPYPTSSSTTSSATWSVVHGTARAKAAAVVTPKRATRRPVEEPGTNPTRMSQDVPNEVEAEILELETRLAVLRDRHGVARQ